MGGYVKKRGCDVDPAAAHQGRVAVSCFSLQSNIHYRCTKRANCFAVSTEKPAHPIRRVLSPHQTYIFVVQRREKQERTQGHSPSGEFSLPIKHIYSLYEKERSDRRSNGAPRPASSLSPSNIYIRCTKEREAGAHTGTFPIRRVLSLSIKHIYSLYKGERSSLRSWASWSEAVSRRQLRSSSLSTPNIVYVVQKREKQERTPSGEFSLHTKHLFTLYEKREKQERTPSGEFSLHPKHSLRCTKARKTGAQQQAKQ